ncbi:MAG: flagellar hook protein FlgE [Gammaproteobacteria bacterium]|nr:flagellar hook protein FlgE [Gammaproteobacteria bacterium]
MPFRIALSGLNSASSELGVAANNIANSSTTGFKKSRAEFSDIYAASSLGTSSNAIGSGVQVSSVTQQFTQGNISFTENNMDLAISGQGFFVMNDNGVDVYTRAGGFGVDRDGYVGNSQGYRLSAYLPDLLGNVTGARGDLQLDTADIAPSATGGVLVGVNMDADTSVPGGANASTAISLGTLPVLSTADTPVTSSAFTLNDAYGNVYNTATVVYTYSGANNVWDAELQIGGIKANTGTVSIDIGTTSSADFNWDPDGASGLQGTQVLSMNTGGLTQSAVANASSVVPSSNGTAQSTFDPEGSTTYNDSTSLTVYDSLGAPHLMTVYFRKEGAPNQWASYTYLDGKNAGSVDISGNPVGDQLTFSTSGELLTPVPPSTVSITGFNPGGGADLMNMNLDYSIASQYGGDFSVFDLSQDGFSTGRLRGVDFSDTGVIVARYTNGQTRTLGQVALATFSNVQGLRQIGDTSWAETFESGTALVGAPGSGSLGTMQSGAQEGSNVDLTEQLISMITAQRNFQANAQVISTADTVTQTIINIR